MPMKKHDVEARHFQNEGVRLIGLPGTDGYLEISMDEAYSLYETLKSAIHKFEGYTQ